MVNLRQGTGARDSPVRWDCADLEKQALSPSTVLFWSMLIGVEMDGRELSWLAPQTKSQRALNKVSAGRRFHGEGARFVDPAGASPDGDHWKTQGG